MRADTTIAPRSSTNYYTRVAAGKAGNDVIQVIDTAAGYLPSSAFTKIMSFYRLFMVPGMGHCYSGPGLDVFGQAFGLPAVSNNPQHDVLSALEQWVEKDQAPDRIIASRYVNDDPTQNVAYSRPLCPYPQVAEYNGVGDQSSADSFACVTPLV